MMSKQFIDLPGGQKLFFQSYGNGGRTVLLLHGLVGGSWLGEEWVNAVEQAGVRCIVPERPGYGDSSQIVLRSVSDWIPIAKALASDLQITSAAVIGCSAGAPYAYATAAALPDSIKKVCVPAVYEEAVLRHYSEQSREAYTAFAEQPQSAVQAYYTAQMEASKQQMANTNLEYIKTTIDEVLAQNCFGMAQESRLQILPWNLSFPEITQPVAFYHSPEDETVPYAAAKEMPAFFKQAVFLDAELPEGAANGSAHMAAISASLVRILGYYERGLY
ncbi:MAG: alpha/beta hydrolase [Oscillospiraceae bacterium]|jgi:pimeloyl-ACP methyl ester carboxylesterase|nr:alpha/beta hydrolase [Oscillospiraceae bacterium]